jgi:hypothetical protein
MDLNGTIGHNVTNQLHFVQEIGQLDIGANGRSSHVVPFDLAIPPELDTAALVKEIALECATNLLKMKMLMAGQARINVLGSVLIYNFGPQIFENRCIPF